MPSGFLRFWVGKYVSAVPVDQRRAEALRLSAKCTIDAVMLGKPLEALEEAAGSDIKTYMMWAMEKATDREAMRMLEKDRPTDAKGSQGPETSF